MEKRIDEVKRFNKNFQGLEKNFPGGGQSGARSITMLVRQWDAG